MESAQGTARRYLAAVAMMVAGVLAISPAAALTCSTSSIAATGPTAYFQYFAASSARTAWTRKVIRNANLGKAYSHWRLANDGKVTCRTIADRFRCVAVASPCRDGKPSETSKPKRGPA